jgi:hypothetical protein
MSRSLNVGRVMLTRTESTQACLAMLATLAIFSGAVCASYSPKIEGPLTVSQILGRLEKRHMVTDS